MKKSIFILASVAAATLATGNVAFAGNRPGAVSVSIADSYYHFADKRNLQNIGVPNAALAYNFDQNWAIEGAVGLLNTNTTASNVMPHKGVHGFLYTMNGLYRFQPLGRFEPYISAGLGVIGLTPNGNNSQQQGNINAGLGTQWFFHDDIAFRAEARDLYTMSGGKNDYMINLGISFVFGGNKPAPAAEPVVYKGEPEPDYKGETMRHKHLQKA